MRIAREIGKFDSDEVLKVHAAVAREVNKTWNELMSLKTGAYREEWNSRDVGGTRFTERVFVTMIAQAQATQEAEVEAEIKFHSRPEVASTPV